MWHYTNGNISHGPMDEAALRGLLSRGVINRRTLVWREGMSEWQPYEAVFEGTAAAEPSGASGDEYARKRVAGPALFMIVSASLSILWQVADIVIRLVGLPLAALPDIAKDPRLGFLVGGSA